MSDIWRKDGERWSLLQPHGFEDEAALQQRIVEAPGMLPLSGQPQLAVLGSEVRLGGGFADVIAVELDGRPVVIEVKLAHNAEARRAVVAQALAYAAALHGTAAAEFEADVVGPHLRKDGHDSLAAAVRAADQAGEFGEDAFGEALAAHLRDGSFRVVIVLDEAPPELVRLVGYLETIADRIVVDLVTVRAYEVGGSQILLPQRVDPGRVPDEPSPRPRPRARPQAVRSEGSGRFREVIAGAPADQQAALVRLADWADALKDKGLARLRTNEGSHMVSLIPRPVGHDAGMATIWHVGGRSITLWRSVIERKAPGALARIENAVAPDVVENGTNADVTPELLDALTAAYREAAGRGESAAAD